MVPTTLTLSADDAETLESILIDTLQYLESEDNTSRQIRRVRGILNQLRLARGINRSAPSEVTR